jgi:hypothetical protein
MPDRITDPASTPDTPDPLLVALERLSAEMHARATRYDALLERIECLFKSVKRVTVAVLVSVLILLALAFLNRSLLTIVNDTVNPDGTRFKDSQKRTASLIVNLSIEDDCRFRRAAANLPAPTSPQPCAAQTPADVYPGKS